MLLTTPLATTFIGKNLVFQNFLPPLFFYFMIFEKSNKNEKFEYFEKKNLSYDVAFLTYDIIFSPKRRLFGNFLQKWVVYTLLKSFSGKTVGKKMFPLTCWIFWKKIFVVWRRILTYDVIFSPKRRLFGNFRQKWVVNTLSKSFSG